jgi:hypothetical protein
MWMDSVSTSLRVLLELCDRLFQDAPQDHQWAARNFSIRQSGSAVVGRVALEPKVA